MSTNPYPESRRTNGTVGGWRSAVLVASILSVAFWFTAMAYTTHSPKGVPPDEWAHITYVHEATQSPALMPDYDHSRILPARVTKNYLKHPPLYYSILGLVGKAFGLDASEDYRAFRAVNAAFVALGVGIWLLNARLLGFSVLQAIPLALSVLAVPMFPYLAGSINNDNLAYLAVAVAFFGLAGLKRFPRAAWYVGAAGLAAAMLTKGTAGLFLALVFGLWCLATLAGRRRHELANRHFAVAVLVLMVVVGGYYLFAYLHYGAFLPTAGTLRNDASPPADPMGFPIFLWKFSGLMAHYLPMIVDHSPVAPLAGLPRLLCFAVVVLPAMAYLVARSVHKRTHSDIILDIMVVAALSTLAAHVLITWESYLRLGGIFGTQPRYYFYLIPGFAVFAFAGLGQSRPVKYLFGMFVVVVFAACAIVPIRTIKAERLEHAPEQLIELRNVEVPMRPLRQTHMIRAQAGWIDQASVAAGTMYLRGWAIDVATSEPAAMLDIYYDGERIGSLVPNKPRPDVATALGDEDARRAGFEGVLKNLPTGISPCDMEYAAVQKSGQLVAVLPSDAVCGK